MRQIRTVAALIVAVAAAAAVYRFAYLPWRADVERKRLEAITLALWDRSPAFVRGPAQENVARARNYLDRGVHNTGLYMAAAANYRLLDDLEQAAEMYRTALHYDQRPELYFNLGVVELGRGQIDAGKQALIRAALFNPYLIPEIPDSAVRDLVEVTVGKRRVLPWLGKLMK
jgi:tetratricopeptide (TPR) repeat protein